MHIDTADDEQYKKWEADLWKYTRWTPEDCAVVYWHCSIYIP